MAFQNSFTGKGTYTPLPSGEGLQRAQEKMSDLILSGEKLKQDTFRKNSEEFAKASDVDPIFVLSDSARKAQSELLNKFNTYWGKIYKERGGNLTEQDKVSMARDKDYLTMEQGNMKSNMDKYLQDRAIVEKDRGQTIDIKDWLENGDKVYRGTGTYNYNLIPKAKPIEQVFGNRKIANSTAWEDKDSDPNRIASYSASKESAAPQIAEYVIGNEAVKRHALEEWDKYTPQEKAIFLDANGDGVVDDNEKQAGGGVSESVDNPIIKAYVDKHWQNLVDVKFVNKQKPPSVGKTFDWNINIGSGHNQNSKFEEQKNILLGKEVYGSFYNLGRQSFTSDPQMIQEYKDLETGENKELNKATRFEVVGYSPDKDQLVVKVVDRITGLRDGKLIGLDAYRYNDLLKSKPFGIDRESLRKPFLTGETKQGELDNL